MVVAIITGFNAAWAGMAGATAVIGVAIVLLRADRGEFPGGIETVGDLAKRAAALNRRSLFTQGARRMPNSEWETLVAIAADHSTLNANDIGPDAHLFANTLKTHRTRS
ncbi:hypothetical protein ACFOMD_17735 [Sphingoaurantiacus capsulatus]|uniref:Uncharacterized protein n=1 Tax=Sphingoaurantiacus capsulatus TaxID=1771310 RepID=A0ABV7XGI2_9SPHN